MGPDFAIGTGWYKVGCYLREYFISVLMALEFWFDESMEDMFEDNVLEPCLAICFDQIQSSRLHIGGIRKDPNCTD